MRTKASTTITTNTTCDFDHDHDHLIDVPIGLVFGFTTSTTIHGKLLPTCHER